MDLGYSGLTPCGPNVRGSSQRRSGRSFGRLPRSSPGRDRRHRRRRLPGIATPPPSQQVPASATLQGVAGRRRGRVRASWLRVYPFVGESAGDRVERRFSGAGERGTPSSRAAEGATW